MLKPTQNKDPVVSKQSTSRRHRVPDGFAGVHLRTRVTPELIDCVAFFEDLYLFVRIVSFHVYKNVCSGNLNSGDIISSNILKDRSEVW